MAHCSPGDVLVQDRPHEGIGGRVVGAGAQFGPLGRAEHRRAAQLDDAAGQQHRVVQLLGGVQVQFGRHGVLHGALEDLGAQPGTGSRPATRWPGGVEQPEQLVHIHVDDGPPAGAHVFPPGRLADMEHPSSMNVKTSGCDHCPKGRPGRLVITWARAARLPRPKAASLECGDGSRVTRTFRHPLTEVPMFDIEGSFDRQLLASGKPRPTIVFPESPGPPHHRGGLPPHPLRPAGVPGLRGGGAGHGPAGSCPTWIRPDWISPWRRAPSWTSPSIRSWWTSSPRSTSSGAWRKAGT